MIFLGFDSLGSLNGSERSSDNLVASDKSINSSLKTSKGAISVTSLASSYNIKTDGTSDGNDYQNSNVNEQNINRIKLFNKNARSNGSENIDNSDSQEIYDICDVETVSFSDVDEDEIHEETLSIAKATRMQSSAPDPTCPYINLPAGHLAISKSTKYGQLQRIERRLFFDQNKKCYCGILNDWLLCYMEGPTSSNPSVSLYLKLPGIEVEHFGEGKRRDICFQISTSDSSRRYTFQALNEVDAKEWIHAIESAIRNESFSTSKKLITRKLPTPPNAKRLTFFGSYPTAAANYKFSSSHDSIYEEPWFENSDQNAGANSTSLIEIRDTTNENEDLIAPELPTKQNSPLALSLRFEYDIPKTKVNDNRKDRFNNNTRNCNKNMDNHCSNNNINKRNSEDGKCKTLTPKLCLSGFSSQLESNSDNLNFQAKVRTIHSKLSSQLNTGQSSNFRKLNRMITSYQVANQSDASDTLLNGQNTLPTCSSFTKSHLSSSHLSDQKKHKKISFQGTAMKLNIEKSGAKNWLLNRLTRSNSMIRPSASCASSGPNGNFKMTKHGEKQTLLNVFESSSSDAASENTDGNKLLPTNEQNLSNLKESSSIKTRDNSRQSSSSLTASSISLNGARSKVNMIINQLEASGQLIGIFNGNSTPSSMFGAFVNGGAGSDCNNYEPILSLQASPPPATFLKRV